MKKILLFLVCSSFFCAKCGEELQQEPTIEGGPFPYRERVNMTFYYIKDTRLKSIKVTLKNLDGIKPQFNININGKDPYGKDALTILNDKEGRFVAEEKQIEYSSYDPSGRICYFRNVNIVFSPPGEKLELSLGKKRIYEMKLYLNDKLFFTKKISFTPERYREGALLESIHAAHKTEVDDMKYLVSIRRFGGFPGYNCFIKITDDDIKKWLDGKP